LARNAWRAVATATVAQLICGPALAGDQIADPLLSWHDGAAEFSVGQGAVAGGLGGRAAFAVNSEAVPFSVEGSAFAGEDPDRESLWQKSEGRLELNVPALNPLGLKLSADVQMTVRYVAAGPAVGLQKHANNITAGAELTIKPLPSFGISAGVGLSQHVQEVQAEALLRSRADLTAQFAHLGGEWKLGAGDSLKIDVKDEHAAVGGREAVGHDYFAPSALFAVVLWRGASWRLKVERHISSFDDKTFAPLAVANAAIGSREPDHAWQAESVFAQTLGDAHFEAKLSADGAGTRTEVGGAVPAPSPVSARLRSGEDAELAVSMPLAPFGLPKTSLKVGGDWESASIEDPLTHLVRRPSGSKPYTANVESVHAVARLLDVGVNGQACGSSAFFTPGEVSEDSRSAGIGAFLRFKPGPFELDLNAGTAIAGKTATQYLYRDTRADSPPLRAAIHQTGGVSLALSLKKNL